jgi:hypothetical protein
MRKKAKNDSRSPRPAAVRLGELRRDDKKCLPTVGMLLPLPACRRLPMPIISIQ